MKTVAMLALAGGLACLSGCGEKKEKIPTQANPPTQANVPTEAELPKEVAEKQPDSITKSLENEATPVITKKEDVKTSALSNVDLMEAIGYALQENTAEDFIQKMKDGGAEVSVNADGSTKVVDSDGTIICKNADSTWFFKEVDGSEGQVGGSWPDNKFTRILPKASFAINYSFTLNSEFSAVFAADKESIRKYIEEMKAGGFTIDCSMKEDEWMGSAMITFSAKNKDGYAAEVYLMTDMGGITIEK